MLTSEGCLEGHRLIFCQFAAKLSLFLEADVWSAPPRVAAWTFAAYVVFEAGLGARIVVFTPFKVSVWRLS